MKLSKFEQQALAKSAIKRKSLSMRQQILTYPGRCVGLTTAERRMKQYNMSLHDACTTPNMNYKG